ncbi:MAG TPA: hypothetical protein VIT67_18355 [Povalibacter sp.]
MARFVCALFLCIVTTCAGAQTSGAAIPCAEEFIQDYAFDGVNPYANITPCPGDHINTSPAWPQRREETHKEYSNGAFYTRHVTHDWELQIDQAQRDCIPVSRRVTRVYWTKQGNEEETVRVVNGGAPERSSQTGGQYGGLIRHGGAKSRTPRLPSARYENTPFGIECLRIDGQTPGAPAGTGNLCEPVLPTPKCRAELYLMPIELRVPIGDQQAVGRTTRLTIGARGELVDRSAWVMP